MQLGTVGSGLDVETIVSALVDADVAPKTNSLDRKESGLKAELTALGTLKSNLSLLEQSVGDLSDGSAFDLASITSSEHVSLVQTGSPASAQYSLDVNALAASQVLASPGFASATTVVGTGTLTFQIGNPSYSSGTSGAYSGFVPDATKTVSITIDSTNNTLGGIRDAVNASGVGVTASLVADGDNTRLLFTADSSGADTAMSIVTDDADGDDSNTSGLSRLAYNTSAGFSNMTEARSSQDASFSLNGLALTSASNKLSNLIEGVDVTLTKVTTTTESILIEKDAAAIEKKVLAFVDAFNSYQSTLTSLMDYTNEQGALSGDSTARRIQSAIREATTGTVSLADNTYSSIVDIGIEADRYGVLKLNSSKFQAALSSNGESVKALFAGDTTMTGLTDNTNSNGVADKLKNAIKTYVDSATGMLSAREARLDDSIADIADDRLKITERMEALEERYTKQFTAMDTLVGQLQSTSDFLTSQMDALKAAANR